MIEKLLMRRGEILKMEVGGKPAGVTEWMIDKAITEGRLTTVKLPGRIRKIYLRSEVLRVFGLETEGMGGNGL